MPADGLLLLYNLFIYFKRQTNFLIWFNYWLVFGCTGCFCPTGGWGLFCSCGEQGLLARCCLRASSGSGFSCWGARAPGGRASVIAARGLGGCSSHAVEHRLNKGGSWALVVLWHVGSSWDWTRDGTHVSSTGRRTFYHWATREPPIHFKNKV